MILYFSGFTLVPFGTHSQIKSSAQVAGADGPQLELRTDTTSPTGWNVTASSVPIPPPLPNDVSLLVDTNVAPGLDGNVPNVIRNRVNNGLGTNLTGTITFRQLFTALMTTEGSGKWGTLRPGESGVFFSGLNVGL